MGESGLACLRFADHSTLVANVVIGADGIKSVVRTQSSLIHGSTCYTGRWRFTRTPHIVFGSEDKHLVDTGACAYRGQVPTKVLMDAGLQKETVQSALIWIGTDKVPVRS